MLHIIDLDAYPLDQPDSDRYRTMVNDLAEKLNTDQVCTLPRFLRDNIRREEIDRAMEVLPQANPAHSYRNVYLERSKSEDLPDDHPRNILAEASYKMLGAHLLPEDSALKTLYRWDLFRSFVADVTGSNELYPSADAYQPVNVLCHEPGDKSAWHFDSTNSFTMTLTLQSPEDGGVFEMSPNIRSAENPNLEGLAALLKGDRSTVKQFDREDGALMMFRGCHSAHRVTEVRGNRPRLMCVMVYEDKPGVVGDPVVNETVYGVKPG